MCSESFALWIEQNYEKMLANPKLTKRVGKGGGTGNKAAKYSENHGVEEKKQVVNYGDHKSATKWTNQMQKRGWTEEQINEAVEYGEKFDAPNNINPTNGATRYVNPETGRSVVIDNKTGELLHVGGDGFEY